MITRVCGCVQGLRDDLLPYMLTAHMDVVVVDKDKWTHDPWGGQITTDPATGETHIWGRGSFDNKAGVMVSMERGDRGLTLVLV